MSRGGSGSRVYVGGLLDSVRKEDLEKEFSKYGKLSHVWVAWNPPGFAFIEYDDEADAEEAVRSLNGQDICGSRVRVELSRGRGRGGMRGGRGGGRGGDRGGGRGMGFRGSSRGMRGGGGGRGMRDRGGRSSFGSGGGGFSRGRPGRDRFGDEGSSSYNKEMSGRGDRERYDQYDSGDYYSSSSSRPVSSSYRSRSPLGGRRRPWRR